MTRLRRALGVIALLALLAPCAMASGFDTGGVSISIDDVGEGGVENSALRIVLLLTILAVAPSILLMMTCFVRFIVALHFLRQALGAPQMPPNQVVVGLALFLTLFAMTPTIDRVYREAWLPYEQGDLDMISGVSMASEPLKEFMLRNTRQADLKLFTKMSRIDKPETPEEIPMRVVLPSFVISELKTGFQIGFLLFLPFLVIDLVVASVLLSMGMMMLPPAMVSLPFKVLLFVLVDGWSLIAGSLVAGMN